MATPRALISIASLLLATTSCVEDSVDPSFDDRDLADAEDIAPSIPVSTYYIVTHVDYRDCVFPTCGGVFVRAVNRHLTTCADGTLANECHAAVTDFSALGLSDEELALLQSRWESSHVLVRGDLFVDEGPYDPSPPTDTLEVSEAWSGVTDNTPTGAFVRLDDTGIVCVTYPCPTFIGRVLNSAKQSLLAEVDLAASGATPAQVAAGFAELFATGLLAAGSDTVVIGPAGSMPGFAASEFYSRVVAGSFSAAELFPEQLVQAPVEEDESELDTITAPDDPISAGPWTELLPIGESCGSNTCGKGLHCCNASCGWCVPPGIECIQIACDAEI